MGFLDIYVFFGQVPLLIFLIGLFVYYWVVNGLYISPLVYI